MNFLSNEYRNWAQVSCQLKGIITGCGDGIGTGAHVKAQELSCFSKLSSLNVAITAKHSSDVSIRR